MLPLQALCEWVEEQVNDRGREGGTGGEGRNNRHSSFSQRGDCRAVTERVKQEQEKGRLVQKGRGKEGRDGVGECRMLCWGQLDLQ